MQKNTLVLIARLRSLLVGLVVILTSMVNTAASAAVSPVPLLVEQCLNYRFPQQVIDPQQNSKTNAITLERHLIGFFNINDRIKYYRQFPLSYSDRELVLQCQLYLADALALFLDSAEFQALQFNLADDNDPQVTMLLAGINRLSRGSQSPTDKARLHTAQAAFKQELSTQALSLNISDLDCKIADKETSSQLRDFNGSLAHYLIKQTDEQCRKRVWQAYQSRASTKNRQALATITQLRDQQAKRAGFVSYTQQQLHRQQLNNVTLVESFLQSQTTNIAIAPWNLGSELAKATAAQVNKIDSNTWLAKVAQELETLALKLEWINQKSIRVWHKQRLLGDIYLSDSKRVSMKSIRQLVIGQQFGQIELSLPKELTRYQQQQQAIKMIATAIKKLSQGRQFYLLNTLGETDDTNKLDALWLEAWLTDKLLGPAAEGSREALLAQYAEQLSVFRAKVAINLYRAELSTNTQNHQQAFYASFGQYWDNTNDAPYTFSAIVYQGPLYYQKLWQQQLAQYIYQSTKSCLNQAAVFDTLVVNENAHSIESILLALLGSPVDADSLIKRIHYAFDAQDHYPSRCTFLRQ